MNKQSEWSRIPSFGKYWKQIWASPVTQMAKNLPAMQETRVWSLGWEDPLEKEMATHSSTLAREIAWTEEANSDLCLFSECILKTYIQTCS